MRKNIMDKRSQKWYHEDVPGKLAKRLIDKLGIKSRDELITIVKNEYDEYLAEYSLHHFSDPETKFCSLCGNGGIIDTTETAISPKGLQTGRKNWCCCPNGVAHRKAEFHGELNNPNSY